MNCFFFFNDTATTEIYTLSLHDALPISGDGDHDVAVQEEADGDIVVTIASLKDADGLERALEEHGVEAEVTYGADDLLPDVREVPAPSGDHPGPRMETGGATTAEPSDGPLDCEVIAVELRGDEITFRLPAEAVAAASPLQIRTAGETDGWSAIAVQWERPVC